MNEENLKYLNAALKFHGFLQYESAGEKLQSELGQKIREGLPHFQLPFQASINGKTFEAVLNFRKADNSDMYFFNSYTAKLDRGIRENIEQTFYINNGGGNTAKEAYNLLDGRSVFKEMTSKEGARYHTWTQLDPTAKDKNGNYLLNHYHSKYGFELGKALAALPIKELGNDEDRIKLNRSLERGNLQVVTVERKGKEERMFIEANPKFKTLNVYDAGMQRLKKNVADDITKTSTPKREASIDNTNVSKPEKKSISTKGAGKTKDKEAGSLLPKKREGKKRGLTQ